MQTEVPPESLGIISSHRGNDALSSRQRRSPRRDAGKVLEDRLRYRRVNNVKIAKERRIHGIDHAKGNSAEIGFRCDYSLQSL